MNWVSLSEKDPESGRCYLAILKSGGDGESKYTIRTLDYQEFVEPSVYAGDKVWYEGGYMREYEDVAYWMELSEIELPKEL